MRIGTAPSSVMGVVSAGSLIRSPATMVELFAAKAGAPLHISSVKKDL
jgi:hypothetical protein